MAQLIAKILSIAALIVAFAFGLMFWNQVGLPYDEAGQFIDPDSGMSYDERGIYVLGTMTLIFIVMTIYFGRMAWLKKEDSQ